MAIDNFAPEYFSQQLSPLEMFDYPWVGLAGARPLDGPGNKLTWGDLEGSVSSALYVDNADAGYSAMEDEIYSITVAEFRNTAFYVTDIEAAQRMPNAMANGMSQAMREQMVALNATIRTAYRRAPGDTPAGRLAASGLTEPIRGNTAGLTSNLKAATMLHSGAAAVSGKNNWGTANGRAQIYDDILEAERYIKRHAWAGDRAAAIVPLEMWTELEKLLTVDRINMGRGSIVDATFMRGTVPMIANVEFYPDKLVGEINTAAATAGTGRPLRMDFLYPGQSVQYITMPLAVESFRDNDKYRTNGRALRLNGAGQDAARYLYSVTYQLTNT